jgi:hypothetical protein
MYEIPMEEICQANKQAMNIYRKRLILFRCTFGLGALALGIFGFFYFVPSFLFIRLILVSVSVFFFLYTTKMMEEIFDKYMLDSESPYLMLFARPTGKEDGFLDKELCVSLEEYVPKSLHISWWGKVSYKTRTKDQEFIN